MGCANILDEEACETLCGFLALLEQVCKGGKKGARFDFGAVLKYSDLVEGRYFTLTVIHQNKEVRVLCKEKENGEAFEYESHSAFSPYKQVILINQVETGVAETSDGSYQS